MQLTHRNHNKLTRRTAQTGTQARTTRPGSEGKCTIIQAIVEMMFTELSETTVVRRLFQIFTRR